MKDEYVGALTQLLLLHTLKHKNRKETVNCQQTHLYRQINLNTDTTKNTVESLNVCKLCIIVT